jgi:ribosome-binding factor A
MKKLKIIAPKQANARKRQDRVATQIKGCIALAIAKGIFQKTKTSEPLKYPVTVTYVDLSRDLKNAKVFVMPIAGMHKDETITFLSEQKGFFKNLIAKEMNLRFVPDISFHIDKIFESSEKVEKLFAKISN